MYSICIFSVKIHMQMSYQYAINKQNAYKI